jgi:hypothetical protein
MGGMQEEQGERAGDKSERGRRPVRCCPTESGGSTFLIGPYLSSLSAPPRDTTRWVAKAVLNGMAESPWGASCCRRSRPSWQGGRVPRAGAQLWSTASPVALLGAHYRKNHRPSAPLSLKDCSHPPALVALPQMPDPHPAYPQPAHYLDEAFPPIQGQQRAGARRHSLPLLSIPYKLLQIASLGSTRNRYPKGLRPFIRLAPFPHRTA